MKLILFCHNLITHGEIDGVHLSVGNYQLEYDVELDKISNLFVLKNLKPGLERGFTIEKILFDGFEIFYWKDFLSFEMLDNRFVENRLLGRENELRFNGVMRICIESKKINYSRWKNIDGWVFNQNLHSCTNDDGCYLGEKNEHKEEFISLPYKKDIFYNKNKKTDYLILGCSVTYGTAVEKNKIWPNLIGKKNINLSVPGFGIDTIYITLKNALKEFSFKKLIILFPNLERRLFQIGKKQNALSIPLTINMEITDIEFQESNYYGIDSKDFLQGYQKTKKKIIKDINNIYSKKIMAKISKLFDKNKIFVSSWNRETYKILPNHFKNILPFFETIDLANDKKHMGPKSHEKWANSIKSLI
jgi:hypothetical protein